MATTGSRPISKSELAAQGRLRGEGESSGGLFASFTGYGSSPPPSTSYVSASPGMGASPYTKHHLSGNMVEYDEVAYQYDERYSSPLIELPGAVYNYLVNPVATGTYYTGKAIVGGTGAVLGAGVHGAAYVTSGAIHGVGNVASGVGHVAVGVASGVGTATGAVVGGVAGGVEAVASGAVGGARYIGSGVKDGFEGEYRAFNDGYYQGTQFYNQGPQFGGRYTTASGASPFATAKVLSAPTVTTSSRTVTAPSAFGPNVVYKEEIITDNSLLATGQTVVTAPQVTEIDIKNAKGEIIERDFIISGGNKAALAPIPAKVLN